MSRVINSNYKYVPTYHIPCNHCGALVEYKKYELSQYYDIDDEPMVEWKCPNCHKRSHMHNVYLERYCIDKTEDNTNEVDMADNVSDRSIWWRVKEFFGGINFKLW